jgi:hypothetical protein
VYNNWKSRLSCDRGCVKCLLASVPIVQDRGATVTAAERVCDGNRMSLAEIVMEIP